MKTFVTDFNLIWNWTDFFGKDKLFFAIVLYVIALMILISIVGTIYLHLRSKGCVAVIHEVLAGISMVFLAAIILIVAGTYLFYSTKTEAIQNYQMFQSITDGEYTVYVNGKPADETKYARSIAMQSMTEDYIIDEDAKEILITERERDRRTLQERRIDAYWEEFKN